MQKVNLLQELTPMIIAILKGLKNKCHGYKNQKKESYAEQIIS